MVPKVSRSEMALIIEDAGVTLGQHANGSRLLKAMATLMLSTALEESKSPGRLPDRVVESAFDVAVEYIALSTTAPEEYDEAK